MADRYVKIKNIIKKGIRAHRGFFLNDISRDVERAALDSFNKYSGKPVQIMLRLPTGMESMIESFPFKTGLCDARIDYFRISIIYLLENERLISKIIEDADSFLDSEEEKRKEMLDEAIDLAMTGSSQESILSHMMELSIEDEQQHNIKTKHRNLPLQGN